MTYPKNSFEMRYLMIAPLMLWLYWQYILVYLIINKMPDPWRWLFLPFGLAFAVQNALFNLTGGWFLYWERPRQVYFSDRIRFGSEERKERFRRLLNPYDPNHID